MSLEITNVRRIDVPRDRVFEAFANPEKLKAWWGPTGFTNSIPHFDFRPGGSWRVVMRSPDGTEYDNLSTFVEVDRPHKVVYEHLQPMHWFLMTMSFRELSPGATELTWKMSLARNAEHEKLRDFLHQANEQNFDRLCAFLDADARQA
jgi:uncharacterized protein YndB with AHSA1/START domain